MCVVDAKRDRLGFAILGSLKRQQTDNFARLPRDRCFVVRRNATDCIDERVAEEGLRNAGEEARITSHWLRRHESKSRAGMQSMETAASDARGATATLTGSLCSSLACSDFANNVRVMEKLA